MEHLLLEDFHSIRSVGTAYFSCWSAIEFLFPSDRFDVKWNKKYCSKSGSSSCTFYLSQLMYVSSWIVMLEVASVRVLALFG